MPGSFRHIVIFLTLFSCALFSAILTADEFSILPDAEVKVIGTAYSIENVATFKDTGKGICTTGSIAMKQHGQNIVLNKVHARVASGHCDGNFTSIMRGKSMLDVENHPWIYFDFEDPNGVSFKSGETHVIEGRITIKGISKKVPLEIRLVENGDAPPTIEVRTKGKLNRHDFNVSGFSFAVDKGLTATVVAKIKKEENASPLLQQEKARREMLTKKSQALRTELARLEAQLEKFHESFYAGGMLGFGTGGLIATAVVAGRMLTNNAKNCKFSVWRLAKGAFLPALATGTAFVVPSAAIGYAIETQNHDESYRDIESKIEQLKESISANDTALAESEKKIQELKAN